MAQEFRLGAGVQKRGDACDICFYYFKEDVCQLQIGQQVKVEKQSFFLMDNISLEFLVKKAFIVWLFFFEKNDLKFDDCLLLNALCEAQGERLRGEEKLSWHIVIKEIEMTTSNNIFVNFDLVPDSVIRFQATRHGDDNLRGAK